MGYSTLEDSEKEISKAVQVENEEDPKDELSLSFINYDSQEK
jgi:hypothetical protein